MMKKLSTKKLDAMIEDVYKKHGQNVQIDVFDISKIYAAGHVAYETAFAQNPTAEHIASEMDIAIYDIVTKLRKN